MNRQSQNEAAETYLLGHTPAALQRLLVQGQMLNPFTRRVLEDAGISSVRRARPNRSSDCRRRAMSSGLVSNPFIPAAVQRASSSDADLAVSARMGT